MDVAKRLETCLVIAGDLFDKWNPGPALVNTALEVLSGRVDVYAVPGQHDLPYHSYANRKQSAYWTLVQAGAVLNLTPGMGFHAEPYGPNPLVIFGFPWGTRPSKPPAIKGKSVRLAVVHAYCWESGHTHPGADQYAHVDEHRKALAGFDAAVFGDNHSGFLSVGTDDDSPKYVLNCGTLMRRTTAEVGYQPHYGVLYSDGRIIRFKVQACKRDKFRDSPLQQISGLSDDLVALLETLPDRLSEDAASLRDFRTELYRRLAEVDASPAVRKEVLDALGEGSRADV